MEAITIYPENKSQLSALKAMAKALKIKITEGRQEESPYDPVFVAKIKESQSQIKEGKFKKIATEDLWK